jgi:glucokinase
MVIAADVGATNVRVAVFDDSLRRLSFESVCIRGLRYPRIIDVLETTLGRAWNEHRACESIGLSMAGHVDVDKGTISHHEIGVRGHHTHAVCMRFGKAFRMPVYLENDGNAACIAECVAGAARGVKDVVSLTLGTFVGSSSVRNSVMQSRKTSGAALGNMLVPVGSSVEPAWSVCGGHCIGEAGSKRLGKDLSCADVFALARAGSRRAGKVVRQTGYALGHLLTKSADLLNPEVIVLTGSVMKDAGQLLPPALEVLRDNAAVNSTAVPQVVVGKFGSDAGLIGAAIVALIRGNSCSYTESIPGAAASA